MAQMVEGALKSGGVDIAKLEKLRAEERNDALRILKQEQAEIAKQRPAIAAAYRQGIADRRAALKTLKNPFLTYFVDVDTPALILETPHADLGIFIDQYIAAGTSWVKVLVNTMTGGEITGFHFYFLWSNDTQLPATIINASTSLAFNGNCSLSAAGNVGIFSGDSNYAYVGGALSVYRWSGWGNDPMTGQDLDGTEVFGLLGTHYGTVADLNATGGGIFGGPGTASKQLNDQPLNLNAGPLSVPPGAEVMFDVIMTLNYGFTAGGDYLGDQILIDFAKNDLDYLVLCPGLLLEVAGPVAPSVGP